MSFIIICYADDKAVLSPSKVGIEILLDSLAELLSGICLKINIYISCYIIFKHRRAVYQPSPVKLLGQALEMISECKNLDVVSSETLCIKRDVD